MSYSSIAPTSKTQFFEGARRLAYGNCLRTWTAQQFLDERPAGRFSLRSLLVGSVRTRFHMTSAETVEYLRTLDDPGQYLVNECPPDELLLWQGNIERTTAGLLMEGSSVRNISHRQATGAGFVSIQGLAATLCLQTWCWPKSYLMLDELLALDAVVEIGIYACQLGRIPGHNTIVWEVRSGY